MADDPNADFFPDIPDQDLWEIWESIKAGAKTPAESLGFDAPAMTSVERMAVGYYRARRYDAAAAIYGFLIQMEPERASAWRGLGACAQAMREYELAMQAFERAVDLAPDDLINQVFLGECLCQLGRRDEGVARLQKVIDSGNTDPAVHPYVVRARAIVGQKGGIPPKVVLRKAGQDIVKQAEAEFTHTDFSQPPLELDPDRDIDLDDIKRNPELMKAIGDLKELLFQGKITLAEVGGFTDNELDGAYAVACKYVEMGQVGPAMQIAGYLIFIDPYKARYYQLVGICLQRLQQYEAADHYYSLSSAMDPDDAMSRIYRGEAKLLSGKIDDGLQSIKDGLALAQKDPVAHKDLIDRANVLLRQFSA